jgi:cytochrome c553
MRGLVVMLVAMLLAPGAAGAVDAGLCASCHGANGVPADGTVPVIWGQRADYLARQLRDYRAGTRDNQIMSSVAEALSDADIDALSSYFGGQPWAGAALAGTKMPADVALCSGCHQQAFGGGEVAGVGPVPRLAGQQRGYLLQTMQDYADGTRDDGPVMPAIMKALPEATRVAVADWLGATAAGGK